MVELLRTKLYIPRPRSNFVSRPRLIERLNAGQDKKLALIAAPAGFGKTTLLSEWIPQSPCCVTWLSLDEGDNDPTRFWTYLITSLQQLNPGIGDGALTLLQSPQPPPVNSILTALINDIIVFPDMFSTVLDDYHFIVSQPIHEALTFLIDHLPDNMNLVITTRVDPDLQLARLRARDDLIELRANELRFSVAEAADFLNQVMGCNLSKEQVTALEKRTEGWIAGLQIAALSIQSHEDIPGFIQAFSGSHRHILGYLAEEVLNKQTQDIQNFLLQTSILDRMCGSLCNAVTGETGGQEMLENLEHANLFLLPLDDEGKWYRFHHLFAQVLQARLQRSHPDLLVELHERASAWYELHDDIVGSIHHALAAGNTINAADLIERERWKLLGRGEINTLRSWLDALPVQIVRDNPGLNIAYALIFTFLEKFEGIEAHIQDAERALEVYAHHRADHPAQAIDAVRSEIATLRAASALRQSNIPRAVVLCRSAINLLPGDNPLIHGFATFYLGLSEMRSGHTKEAEQIFIKASSLCLQADNIMLAMFGLAFLSTIQISMGRLGEAYETSQRILRIPTERLRQARPVASLAYSSLAILHYEWNDLNAAERYSHLGIEAGRLNGMTSLEITCHRILANTLQAQHNPGGTDQVLGQIAALDDQLPNPIRSFHSAALKALLKLRQGHTEMAISWAETCGMHSEDTDLPFAREMEYLVLARVLIAQGQTESVLDLLARLLQAAEINHRIGSVIEILTLQSLARQKQGDLPGSFDTLEYAMSLAESQGYVRIFVDEGDAMRLLLENLQAKLRKKIDPSRNLLAYTDKLLAAFPDINPVPLPIKNLQPETISLPESISDRELAVLRLIASGASNAEIAETLFIALSTVKSHTVNLYGKLGVNSRTQAVVRAQQLGLLS